MKHARIKIRDDKGQYAAALKRANRSLCNRIKELKKEGREISHTMLYVRTKLALLDGWFGMDTSDIIIDNHVTEFNGIVNFMAYCKEYPEVFMISIDKED